MSPAIGHTRLDAITGPLMVVGDVAGVGWDEVAEIRLESGEVRHGVVLDVHDDLAVVEVFEGTGGIGIEGASVSFSGSPMRIPVGAGWLGRVCNGRGEPLDGGPPILGEETREVAGEPINPARRERPADPVLTGISAIDGMATLVRGQKLPIFSVGGLPHLELAAQIAAQAQAGDEPFAVVFAAIGMTHADAADVGSALAARGSAGDLVVLLNTAEDPVVERLVTPRLALTIAEHLAFARGPPRPGRHGRPDELLRGAARGVLGTRGDPLAPRLPRPPLQRPRLAAGARRPHRGGRTARSRRCPC